MPALESIQLGNNAMGFLRFRDFALLEMIGRACCRR